MQTKILSYTLAEGILIMASSRLFKVYIFWIRMHRLIGLSVGLSVCSYVCPFVHILKTEPVSQFVSYLYET